MPLSNFIKNILNIQDNNISFPEEEYYQVNKIDEFHIVNLLNRAFNQTRISIINSIQKDYFFNIINTIM